MIIITIMVKVDFVKEMERKSDYSIALIDEIALDIAKLMNIHDQL